MPLTARDIRNAFEALAKELARQGHKAEIAIAGGAALVLLFDARLSTKDVDAVFLTPAANVVRNAALAIAERLDLPADWLNDGAKGYFVGLSSGEILFQAPGLIARSVSTQQLLGMKLAAWRDAIDRADAEKNAIWTDIERFVPRGEFNKAMYAFDDLWEATHGA